MLKAETWYQSLSYEQWIFNEKIVAVYDQSKSEWVCMNGTWRSKHEPMIKYLINVGTPVHHLDFDSCTIMENLPLNASDDDVLIAAYSCCVDGSMDPFLPVIPNTVSKSISSI